MCYNHDSDWNKSFVLKSGSKINCDLSISGTSWVTDCFDWIFYSGSFGNALYCRAALQGFIFFFSLVAGRPTVPSFRSSLWFGLFFRQWEVELDSLELAQLFSFFFYFQGFLFKYPFQSFLFSLFISSVSHKAKSCLMWMVVVTAALTPSSSTVFDTSFLFICRWSGDFLSGSSSGFLTVVSCQKREEKKKLKHERYHPPTTAHWRRLLGNLPGNTYVQRWHYLLSVFFCLLQRHFRITDRLYCMRYVSAEWEWLRAEITAANGRRLSIRVIFFCTCDSLLLDVIMCLKWAVFSWDKFRDLREVKIAVTSAKLILSIRAKLRPLSFADVDWPDHTQQFQWDVFKPGAQEILTSECVGKFEVVI